MEIETADFPELMAALGENTRTVIPFHFLKRKRARAWADEELANVIIETGSPEPMAFIFGENARWQAEVLATLGRQRLYWCPTETVGQLLPTVRQKHESQLSLEPDIQRTVAQHVPIAPPQGAEIRRMTGADLPAIAVCSPDIAWLADSWDSWEELLVKGIVVAAIVEANIVSAAVTFARADALDDIGVATDPLYQRRGLSSACASLLVKEMLAEGRRPVWTVFLSNTPSVRISEKLGFITQTECTVIRQKPEEGV